MLDTKHNRRYYAIMANRSLIVGFPPDSHFLLTIIEMCLLWCILCHNNKYHTTIDIIKVIMLIIQYHGFMDHGLTKIHRNVTYLFEQLPSLQYSCLEEPLKIVMFCLLRKPLLAGKVKKQPDVEKSLAA